MISLKSLLILTAILFFPAIALAGDHAVDLTGTYYGIIAVNIFIIAYALVPLENNIHLRKSKPVLLAAGIIWALVALAYAAIGDIHTPHEAIKHSLLEYAELFLFLLAAMTYINAMEERNVFQSLRAYLVSKGYSLRKIFWITGLLAFFISPVADNLTTALLMGAVVMAVGGSNKKFVAIACINIIVAANAGGAFSPFGDITTLMVWQKGKVSFGEFFAIFIPSVVNWLIPAVIMGCFVAKEQPTASDEEVVMKFGAKRVMIFFLLTIMTAVCFHNFLHLPPAAGMMFGLGYLGALSYYIKRVEGRKEKYDNILGYRGPETLSPFYSMPLDNLESVGKYIDEEENTPAFIIDRNHIITHWNEAMEELTGILSENAVGTQNQWKPFYQERRSIMADLVMDYMPEEKISTIYPGKHQKIDMTQDFFTASDFFPELGSEGKWLNFSAAPIKDEDDNPVGAVEKIEDMTTHKASIKHFDIMKNIARAEWDTLLFFYGVIMCVGGLSQFGYLSLISNFMYTDLGPTYANTLVGILSAIVDNIPVMFAVLTMDPSMSHGQWLLATLTAGTGGSMLAIGSAAGVALMGTARGIYTFGVHLKWTPVIALGYAAAIICHLIINAAIM
ncbi:sodium:proton antiporter NhaD [Desulfobacterales bacterium HSG16]|nr:sodium:proton antiporter NhaD [Desulfobacterales bacterium HSG16]